VLFLNDTPRNGGPGRSLLTILSNLDPRAVERTLVLPRQGVVDELVRDADAAEHILHEPDLIENVIAPWGRAMRREDFRAPLPLRGVRAAGNAMRIVRAVARLSSLVTRGGYDLIYCNGTTADFVGGIVAARTGVPALWHVRYTSIPRAIAPLHRRLAASPAVRRIVCVSRAAAAQFAAHEKVTVLHNGIDLSDFTPGQTVPILRTRLGIDADAVVFGAHGRVLRRKGFLELVRAAAMLLERGPACHFVVVGDTPEDFPVDHVAECRALAAQLRIEKNVHFVGFQKDVRPWVADFDVAVVPSVYADPLPRAVIEAMALEKPVVAFDVGGVAEMLSPGHTGELVPVGDVAALARALAAYRDDPLRRTREGRAARTSVERDFDARGHARAVERLILEASGVQGDALPARIA